MKTFKMLSFDLINEDGGQNIPIIDGIVINQENSRKSWILELFLSKEHKTTFENLKASNEVFEVHVIISFPDNEPAPFKVLVSDIREIGEKITVLLKGTIKTRRSKYAEALLNSLLTEELSSEELMIRFKKGMRERPRIKES
ncbi:YwpF-like family protein [Ureibacillus chungkukjangi]|uniref:YwpF-like family protein n=1 Tax=Ureibacillus chungkukjangi TaxID=1202712 RepID=UPI00203FE24B|nr:YwpF-like family protein [Ureibacillus chungkukjangi]MCM3390323.1 YwpF-like family protein [Ureibacillus chungkukjangi]